MNKLIKGDKVIAYRDGLRLKDEIDLVANDDCYRLKYHCGLFHRKQIRKYTLRTNPLSVSFESHICNMLGPIGFNAGPIFSGHAFKFNNKKVLFTITELRE